MRRTVDKPNTANDTTEVYAFDSSDRLQSENRYSNLTGTGSPIRATTYTWSGTQQSSKVVAIPVTSTVTQSMTYGPGDQLSGVVTETKDGSGNVSARTQVEYRYDPTGVRFIATDSTDSSPSSPTFDRAENGKVEYTIDHANMTGYQQTILETHKNGSGQSTKRISYTFGTDEIAQTVSDLNPSSSAVTSSETLVFGHDGHGSTRVIYGAAAVIAQIYAYTAYGELLAIHNGMGAREATFGGTVATLANPVGAKTSILYNGEGIDNRTGLYNFRARWYSASIGRFERLDPYLGDPNDPFTFNKYNFATSRDPIQFTDPTGMFEGLSGILSSMGIQTGMRGSSGGAIAGAGYWANTALRIIEAANTAVAAFQGYMTGGALGAIAAIVGLDPSELKEMADAFRKEGITPATLFSKLTSGAAGAIPPIYLNLDVPDKGKLGRVFKKISNLVGRSNDLQEFIGEMGAGLLMHVLGFGKANLPVFPSVKGPDFMARQGKTPVWAMVEAKGGSSRLSKGAEYGDQMQWDWIRHWYHWLASKNQNYGAHSSDADGNDLWDYWGHGRLKTNDGNAKPIVAVVVSLDLNRPKDQLKIGVQAWTNRETAWNKWRSDF
jgi:RHS repeat-associated protein